MPRPADPAPPKTAPPHPAPPRPAPPAAASLSDRLTDAVFRGLMALALRLPYERRLAAAGWVVARIVAPLAGYRRRVRDNLALVCPDLPRAEVRRLMLAVPDNLGRALAELYSGTEFTDRAGRLPITGPGREALQEALAARRPVVVATGHIGNYEAVRAAMAARGYPVAALYRPMSNRLFNAHYIAAMEAISQPLFARSNRGMAGMMRFLKAGGMLGILSDQHMGHGARLAFFGHPAMTATSAADLALKYDALLVPVYGIRAEDGIGFEIIAEAPIAHGDPLAMTQAINDSLEARVRSNMGQWLWIHRRWK